MATIQGLTMLLSSGSSSASSCCRKRLMIQATLNAPKMRITPTLGPLPTIYNTDLVEDLNTRYSSSPSSRRQTRATGSDPVVLAKLYAIMEIVEDRAEMHKNIEEQRSNWNHLLLNSINALTLTAATMCGLAATIGSESSTAFKVSSTILYLSATGILSIMNTIQPSQLAEEQRNAVRLFKQLRSRIQTMVSVGNPTASDVSEAIENVLSIDRAYPLPLLGAMLEKFPSNVEPAVWWPRKMQKQARGSDGNGWSGELEKEMRQIVDVLKKKDEADYLSLGRKALKLNKVLAISGPVLTGLAAIGSAFVGTHPMAVMVGVAGGALAGIVNTIEHGGQVGMVFEMYRSNAGFFKLMEETLESNLDERNEWGRENGDVLELKVALQLGRSLSDLKNLAASSSSSEFVLKLCIFSLFPLCRLLVMLLK